MRCTATSSRSNTSQADPRSRGLHCEGHNTAVEQRCSTPERGDQAVSTQYSNAPPKNGIPLHHMLSNHPSLKQNLEELTGYDTWYTIPRPDHSHGNTCSASTAHLKRWRPGGIVVFRDAATTSQSHIGDLVVTGSLVTIELRHWVTLVVSVTIRQHGEKHQLRSGQPHRH